MWFNKSTEKEGIMTIVRADSLHTCVPGTSLDSYAFTVWLHFLLCEGNYFSYGFDVLSFCLGSSQYKREFFNMLTVCHKNENIVVFWRSALFTNLNPFLNFFFVPNETLGFFTCFKGCFWKPILQGPIVSSPCSKGKIESLFTVFSMICFPGLGFQRKFPLKKYFSVLQFNFL